MANSKSSRVLTFIFGMNIAGMGLYIAYINQSIEMNTVLFVSLGGVFMGIDPSDLIRSKK